MKLEIKKCSLSNLSTNNTANKQLEIIERTFRLSSDAVVNVISFELGLMPLRKRNCGRTEEALV